MVGQAAAFDYSKVKNYFYNEDYEELIGYLHSYPLRSLSNETLYYLGYSYIMVGNYTAAKKALKVAVQKKPYDVHSALLLMRILSFEGEKTTIVDIWSKYSDKNIPKEARKIYIKALLALGMDDAAARVSGKNFKTFFLSLKETYDSDIPLLPRDQIPPTMTASGFETQALFYGSLAYRPFKLTPYALLLYQNDRKNSELDTLITGLSLQRSIPSLRLKAISELNYSNVNHKTYSLSGALTFKRVWDAFSLGIKGSAERNVSDSNWSNEGVELLFESRHLNAAAGYKNYSGVKDRIEFKTSYNFKEEVSSFGFGVEPSFRFVSYKNSGRALRGTVRGFVQKNFGMLSVGLEGLLQRSVSNTEYEATYSRYSVGLFSNYIF